MRFNANTINEIPEMKNIQSVPTRQSSEEVASEKSSKINLLKGIIFKQAEALNRATQTNNLLLDISRSTDTMVDEVYNRFQGWQLDLREALKEEHINQRRPQANPSAAAKNARQTDHSEALVYRFPRPANINTTAHVPTFLEPRPDLPDCKSPVLTKEKFDAAVAFGDIQTIYNAAMFELGFKGQPKVIVPTKSEVFEGTMTELAGLII